MNKSPGVSIVICCYNSSGRITPTLGHLQKMSVNNIPWEVILVDNNSSDDTVKIAKQVWELNPVTNLKIFYEKNTGLMHARKKGAAEAAFDIISFIDDDNWVDNKWVENVYRIFEKDSTIAACGGDSVAVFESDEPGWFRDFENSFAVGKQQEQTGYVDVRKGYLWGAGLSIRKSVWQELFDGDFISRLSGRKGKSLSAGEDSEICLSLVRRGWKLWYDRSLTLQHFIPSVRLNKNYLKQMYAGFGKAEVILSLYRRALTGKGIPSWFSQLLSALKLLVHSGFKSIFSTGKQNFRRNILWNHDKAYVMELLMNRKKYYEVARGIFNSELKTQDS